MGGAAVKGDVVLRGAQEPVEVRGEFTRLRKHRNVRGEEVVAVVQNAACGHAGGAPHAFFSRLEENLHFAAELILVVHEPVADRKAHRHVRVMTAGVHEARVFGSKAAVRGNVLVVRAFRHRDAVNVKAQRKRGAGAARVQNGHAPGEFLHFRKKLFTDAVFAGTFNTGLHNRHFTPQAGIRINDVAAQKHLVAVAAQGLHQKGRRGEF